MEIDKEDGSKRPLGIPTVKDRVVQEAQRRVIEPIFEPEFHPSRYAYRPGRSCQAAVAKARSLCGRHPDFCAQSPTSASRIGCASLLRAIIP
ncbi:MAG: reverse transcriptase domain-containing protein [Limnochordia bacterium]